MDPDKTAELVSAAATGDADAWRVLVEHFSGLVWSVARGNGLGRAEAADVAQTTWLRLAERLHRLEHPERVGAWLATTTRREAQRVRRAGLRAVPTADPALLDHGDPDAPTPERELLDAERLRYELERDRRLWRAFEELSARCRELLRVLLASPPPSYAEVSAALDMRIGSIGPTRARCLSRLRENLAQRGITHGLDGSQ